MGREYTKESTLKELNIKDATVLIYIQSFQDLKRYIITKKESLNIVS